MFYYGEDLFEKKFDSEKIMCLCEGRHDIPQAIDGAIFPQVVNPTDFKGMADVIKEKLSGCTHLTLYVTGLTVALVEVLNYCTIHEVQVCLMHYDRETKDYYAQVVL